MKKLRVLIHAILVLTLLFNVFALVSCKDKDKNKDDAKTPVKLATPAVILDGNVARWGADPNAEKFEVSINGVLTYMENSATSVTLSDGQTVKVRAIGDGTQFLTGEWSNPISYVAPTPDPTPEPDPEPDPEPVIYTVTFYDEDGTTVLATVSVKEGEAALYTEDLPEKDDAEIDGKEIYYVFEKWVSAIGGTDEADLSAVRADMSVYAYYGAHDVIYTVTFLGFDGEVIARVDVGAGGKAIAPSTVPAVDGYKFAGWNKSFDKVGNDLLVSAVYERLNRVRFLGYDGSELKVEWVDDGKSATAPTPPTVEGYTFANWNGNYTAVESDVDVYAIYSIARYTVNFKLPDGKLLSSVQVEHGFPAQAPDCPEYVISKEGGKNVVKGFTDWSHAFDSVKSDMEITATYNEAYTGASPVIIVEFVDTVEGGVSKTLVNVYVYVAEGVKLNALQLDFSFECEGNLTVDPSIRFDEASNLYVKGDDNATSENGGRYDLNNNEKTFTFVWASIKGVEFTYCDHVMTLVTSINGGMTVSDSNFKIVNSEANVSTSEGEYVMVDPIVVYLG